MLRDVQLLFFLLLVLIGTALAERAAFGAEPPPASPGPSWAPADEVTPRWRQIQQELADQAAEYKRVPDQPESTEARAERHLQTQLLLRIARALERIAVATERRDCRAPQAKPNPFLIDPDFNP